MRQFLVDHRMTNATDQFAVAPTAEIDYAIAVKADDGKDRVVAEIPRIVLDDCFPGSALSDEQRRKLVEDNIEIFKAIISGKYERGEWKAASRFGSTVRRVDDINASDLRNAPRLAAAGLIIKEDAGFK
jgi:hypothetical protein